MVSEVINLTVPHTLRPGDHFVLPGWNYDRHYLVTGVQGQRITVEPWSRWRAWRWRRAHR